MNLRSKVIVIIFFIVLIITTLISFFKIIINKDYYIRIEIDCNPKIEKCFVYKCDPEDDSTCPENPKKRISYYKIIEEKAYSVPVCETQNNNCAEINCENNIDCREILCDENIIEEEETCSDPETYIKKK